VIHLCIICALKRCIYFVKSVYRFAALGLTAGASRLFGLGADKYFYVHSNQLENIRSYY